MAVCNDEGLEYLKQEAGEKKMRKILGELMHWEAEHGSCPIRTQKY